MATFYTSGRVVNRVDRNKSAEIPKMLVDTGAEFITWINSYMLKCIGVKREKKNYTFVMANRKQSTRAVGMPSFISAMRSRLMKSSLANPALWKFSAHARWKA